MPSIAQQDYIVIAPKVGNTIEVDAYALGTLAKILEKKDTSIFDVILKDASINESPDEHYSRITDCLFIDINGDNYVEYIEDGSIKILNFTHTSTQYEGLAAVQEAGEAQYPGEGMNTGLPLLQDLQSVLFDRNTGYIITDPEGHKTTVTVAEGKIATVAVSDAVEAEGIKVPFEEIQKLIGLPITV